MKLTIVIPCFNESKPSGLLWTQCVQRLIRRKKSLLSIDFSTDGTREILANELAAILIDWYFMNNQGKGAALRSGILHATGISSSFRMPILNTTPMNIQF